MEIEPLPSSVVVIDDNFTSLQLQQEVGASTILSEYPLLPFFVQVKADQHLTINFTQPELNLHLQQTSSSSSDSQHKVTINRSSEPVLILNDQQVQISCRSNNRREFAAKLVFSDKDFATLLSGLTEESAVLKLFRVVRRVTPRPFVCSNALFKAPPFSFSSEDQHLLEVECLVAGILFEMEIHFCPPGTNITSIYRTPLVVGWNASYMFQVQRGDVYSYFYFLSTNRDHAPGRIHHGEDLVNSWQLKNKNPSPQSFVPKLITPTEEKAQHLQLQNQWRDDLREKSEKSFRKRLTQRFTGQKRSIEMDKHTQPIESEQPCKKQQLTAANSAVSSTPPDPARVFDALKAAFDILRNQIKSLTAAHVKPKIVLDEQLLAEEELVKKERFSNAKKILLETYDLAAAKFFPDTSSIPMSAYDLWLDHFSHTLYEAYAAVRDHPELQPAEQKELSMPMLRLFHKIFEPERTVPSHARSINVGLIAFAVGQITQFHASNPTQSIVYFDHARSILTTAQVDQTTSIAMNIARIDSALGNAYRSKDVEKSEWHLRQAVQAQQNEHGDEDHWEVANAKIGLGKTLTQVREFRNRSPDVLLKEASKFLNQGTEMFDRLKHPRSGWAKMSLVSLLAASKEYEKALWVLAQIPKTIDERFPLFLYIARILVDVGKYEDAIKSYNKSESHCNSLQLSDDHRYRKQLLAERPQVEEPLAFTKLFLAP